MFEWIKKIFAKPQPKGTLSARIYRTATGEWKDSGEVIQAGKETGDGNA